MRITELTGRRVIDPKRARMRGTIAEILIDPSTARLAAVDVAPPAGEGTELIPAEAIARIGHDAVMLTQSVSPELAEKDPRRERFLDTSRLIGLEVLGEDG